MNNARRKVLNTIISTLEQVASDIETVKDEEQEAFDNMPDGAQQGDKGQAMESAIQELEDCDIADIIAHLETARDG